jgi:hypothetical protein
MAGSNARAVETGFSSRPLTETARDTQTWIEQTGSEPPAGGGLSDEREAELLAAWHARS